MDLLKDEVGDDVHCHRVQVPDVVGRPHVRTREETLQYIAQITAELRTLAENAGSERLATLLALAHYEVRGLL
jgi:hypothetical protein